MKVKEIKKKKKIKNKIKIYLFILFDVILKSLVPSGFSPMLQHCCSNAIAMQ